MTVELTIAAVGSFVLAFGHAAIGARWVLPSLTKEQMPSTPFGSRSMTVSMLRFTWHVVTVMLVAFGVLLALLAWAPDADPSTLVLRWLGSFWFVAAALAFWMARRRPRSIVRFPVPLVQIVVAVMCWAASVH